MEKGKIDELLEYYVKHMPKMSYLMKNKERYEVIEKSVREISEIALEADKKAKIKIFPDDLTGCTLCMEITASLFVVDKIDKFCTTLKVADTFEVCSLTNGDVSASLTYKDAWMPAPPKK